MVFVRNFLVLLVLLLINLPCLSADTRVTENGYYLDRRGEVKDSYILPPHPENAPKVSVLVQPITNFRTYYKVNLEGCRGAESKLPIVPSYTENYSTRGSQLYKKEDYVEVWCDGEKNIGKIDCLTADSAISFFPLSAWTRGVTIASWRARKYPQRGVAAFYIEDTASSANDMRAAKAWAKKWGTKIMFISIDAGIPEEWI